MKHTNDENGEKYISSFPKLKKWINECLCCHKKGYKPNMPDKISDGMATYFIKKYFEPLELDENGLCSICSEIQKNHKR